MKEAEELDKTIGFININPEITYVDEKGIHTLKLSDSTKEELFNLIKKGL